MPKLPEKVEDWKAPWETETGETEIDKDRLKRYLFGVLGDKEKLQERLSESETKSTELEKENGNLKKQVETKSREGETEVDKLKREVEELKKGGTDKKSDVDPLEVLKLRVAVEKGLNKGQLKRLIGSNEAELLADADELLQTFGSGGKTDGDEGEGDGNDARRTPKGKHNPGDPNPKAGPEVDVKKALDSIPRLN
jgi:hypothetical protein